MQNRALKSIKTIVIITILAVLMMSIIDGIINPGYLYKSLAKIVMFLILPIAYTFFDNKIHLRDCFILKSKKAIFISIGLGFGVYLVIMLAYIILKNFIDLESIMQTLNKDVGVAKDNFIWIALYISFINSFIEEFFFRGFLFLNLKSLGTKWFAYIFSATAFSIYHVAIMGSWFTPILFVVAMIGLFGGGLIFNYLNDKNGNIYNSWIVHMMSNLAINTVGMVMFGWLNL
ncbi:MAG: CPBP family intramembrane metalloprotease [Erysipelothrix sp.]|nr:CPBP family intramembrane metalloprotease [Erysipelothrix sp.]